MVVCNSCGLKSESRQNSFFVQIDVPKSKAKLSDLMERSRPEDTDAHCKKCERECQKTIRRNITYAADNILVHMKRFQKTSYKTSKNDAEVVPTPVYLHINGKRIRYEVCSVVCHAGSLRSGHYTFYSLDQGRWTCFNDAEVTQMESAPTNGYILLLKRDTEYTGCLEEGEGSAPIKYT